MPLVGGTLSYRRGKKWALLGLGPLVGVPLFMLTSLTYASAILDLSPSTALLSALLGALSLLSSSPVLPAVGALLALSGRRIRAPDPLLEAGVALTALGGAWGVWATALKPAVRYLGWLIAPPPPPPPPPPGTCLPEGPKLFTQADVVVVAASVVVVAVSVLALRRGWRWCLVALAPPALLVARLILARASLPSLLIKLSRAELSLPIAGPLLVALSLRRKTR